MITPNDTSRRVDLEAQETYWRNRLGGDLRALLPYLDHPRPPVPAFLRANVSQDLKLQLCQGIHNLCGRTNSTLDVFLLAVFATLLFRYTDKEDFIVRSLSSDSLRRRDSRTLETFTNPVALYANLVGDPSFVVFLDRLAQNVREAAMHRDYPFEKIQRDRNIQQANISRIMFVLMGMPTLISAAPIAENHLDDGAEYINQCDLVFLLTPTDESLTVSCQYDAELFEASTIHRLLGHYETLLQGIVAQPEANLSQLPLLTELERKQLIIEWNDTKSEYPKEQCIQELFEARVEKTPDAIAVALEDQQLTYRELNNHANQLAHYLHRFGVGPDVLVGICMDRSIQMIIGLLGILKAGGAYVPLDASYPGARLGFMLKDTQASLVVSDLASRDSLPSHSDQVICLDRDWKKIAREPQVNPGNPNTADDLACVIYTSGSTGVPKGVEVRHRGVVRLLFGVDYVRLDGTQTFLHLAPISFDAATFEVWGSLLHGGKCVLFPGKVPTAEELGAVLKKHRVDMLWLTAALFNTVINEAPQALSEVKQLLIGGEALSVRHVKKGFAELPNTEIINGYGPTESTTFTCSYSIPHQLEDDLSSIPIGKPIGNTQVYILDPHLNPVPIGVVGELHIGGDGLARGYWNRPELTQEKFIAHPFSGEPGARLYKTGDLARYLADGNIEFLGRMDNQIKIRGYRIELGEIESVLGQHPAIQSSVVAVREDGPGDKQLVGYVVPRTKRSFDAAKVRKYLKQKLPEYMLPSAFVLLDELPLTPSGKVDRRALPAPDQSRPASVDVCQPPRTPTEEVLARIWAEVLKLEKVGIHDNFFELGGHSLLATQIVSRIRAAFSIELPVRHMFESPTVAETAVIITESQAQPVSEA
jgi:amino acid adenylation domain-containing protein